MLLSDYAIAKANLKIRLIAAVEYSESRDRIHDVNRKCALLSAHSVQVDEDVGRFREYALRMKDKADALSR